MRTLSDKWKKKVNTGMDVQYLKYADITLKDGTVLNLTSADLWANGFSFEDSVSGDNSFDIGSTIINVLTLSINNFDGQYSDYDFDGAEVVCYVGMQFDDGSAEKVRICTVNVVEQPEDETVTIDLTCEDNMHKFDRNYSDSKLNYPATRGQIIRDACEVCGVSLQTTSFYRDDYIVQVRPNDEALTFRQVLQWVAQIGCQWMRCDEYGRLCIGWYSSINEKELIVDDLGVLKTQDDSNISLELSSTNGVLSANNGTFLESDGILRLFATDGNGNVSEIKTTYGFTPHHTDVVITGVKVTEYSESSSDNPQTYMVGTEGYVLGISGNKLIRVGDGQTVASIIAEKCVGMKFRPFESVCPTDISLEAGDTIIIVDRNEKIYTSLLTATTLQPGSGQKIACNAKSAAKNSSTQYSQATQAFVTARNMVKQEKTEREKALEEFKERLDNAKGVYTTIVKQEDGSNIFYLHDAPTLEKSQAVWKMTSEAWGVSTDGGQTWNGGMTVDGDTIVRILNAVGVNANWINAGAITVKDADGNIIFQVDMDTKSVYISGSVQIGGGATLDSIKQTADDAAKKANEASEAAAAAKNMTLILSNEFQAIAADSDGNITTFPECKTTATVMYGSTDVTAECTFTVTKSDNVAGSWDDSTRTYTVTGLTADDGWIDIKAAYIKALSVTKRFSLAKQKAGSQGTDGESGRSYSLESSCNIIKQKESGALEPTYINFEAFYFDGASAERKDYTGIYTIEESSDSGVTWKEVYRSGTNEHSVKHHMYLGIRAYHYREGVQKSGVLAGSDGSGGMIAFGVPKTVTDVRCSFYAQGSYSTGTMPESKKIASKTISVISEKVKSLSQSDIVEILSDNGKFNGLYYVGGKLYISLSALLGGEMTLGGVNNGNGILRIRDSNNRLNMELSNGGQILYDKNELVSAVLQQDKLFFFDNSVSITNNRQDITGICLSNKGLVKFDGHIYKDSNNNIYFESSFVSADGQSEELTPLYYDSKSDGLIGYFLKIVTDSMSTGTLSVGGANFSYQNEILTINKAISLLKRLSVSGALSVGGDSEIKGDETIKNNLYVEGNATITDDLSTTGDVFFKSIPIISGGSYVYIQRSGQIVKGSSSSRRYKNIGAPISEQDILGWYNIQPVWASYKEGYLAKGDEREGIEFPMFEAENVAQYMPLAVDHLPDGRVETWNERVMIPMMFAMLKSQKDKIDKMQETIDRLIEKIGE